MVPCDLPAKKLIFSGTGSLENDWDDIRSFAHASKSGMKKAIASGSKKPLLIVNANKYLHADMVAILGALEALYVPIGKLNE